MAWDTQKDPVPSLKREAVWKKTERKEKEREGKEKRGGEDRGGEGRGEKTTQANVRQLNWSLNFELPEKTLRQSNRKKNCLFSRVTKI